MASSVARVEFRTGSTVRLEAKEDTIEFMARDSSGRSVILHIGPDEWESLALAGKYAVDQIRRGKL